MSLSRPALHALLNGTTATVLMGGYLAVKTGRTRLHRAAMLTGFLLSALFFGSYLDYHARVGATRFSGTGVIRLAYLLVLTTHTVLAAAVVPMVITTLGFAFRGKFDRHRAWARWTWPIWMYVCVTGVGIYFALYGRTPHPYQ